MNHLKYMQECVNSLNSIKINISVDNFPGPNTSAMLGEESLSNDLCCRGFYCMQMIATQYDTVWLKISDTLVLQSIRP